MSNQFQAPQSACVLGGGVSFVNKLRLKEKFQDYFIWWELQPGGIGVTPLLNSVCLILDFNVCFYRWSV